MGEKARKQFEDKYTAEKNYEKLINIYNRIILLNKTLKYTPI